MAYKWVKSLTTWIFIAFFGGILAGHFLGESILFLANPMAAIFINSLKMVVMPLIIFSIVSGILNLGSGKNLEKLGLKTIAYYIMTTAVAIITGQILVSVVKPGVGAENLLQSDISHIPAAEGSIVDMLVKVIPTNPFSALAEGNVIQVIFFLILFSMFTLKLNEKHRLMFTDFFQGGFDIMMKMVHIIVWMAPVGVLGIVARIVAQTGFEAIEKLLAYFIVVVVALLIHAIINMSIILKFLGRVSPIKHAKNMLLALQTAFFTSSSMATLPLTMECVIEKSGVPKKVANFVLPIGATVNMDGTALYEAVAVIFIAQVYNIELTFVQLIMVLITTILASIGTAAIPMAGFVMITIILKAVGLPLEGVGLVLAVDRLLDMMRTTVNVWGDSCGSVVIAKSEGEELKV